MISARRLRPYFQAHPIVVLTDHPLRLILQKPEASGRLMKWSIELSEFNITYRPRPAIKAQVLADFVSEFTSEQSTPTSVEGAGSAEETQFDPALPIWQLYVDATRTPTVAGPDSSSSVLTPVVLTHLGSRVPSGSTSKLPTMRPSTKHSWPAFGWPGTWEPSSSEYSATRSSLSTKSRGTTRRKTPSCLGM